MINLHRIDPRVLLYFSPWISVINDIPIMPEKTAGLLEVGMVRQHFLFYTAIDILCFCHFHQHLLKNNGSNIFSAIGINPCSISICHYAKQFIKVKIITVFDSDLLGKVLDCKVALALLGKETHFKLHQDKLLFTYKGNEFAVDESQFSLNYFFLLTGIRTNHRTIKPKGAVSFYQLLAQQSII